MMHRKVLALGRLKTGEMNKLEALYASQLHMEQIEGDVLWYKFEGVKLRLADNTFYTPDFFVMDGSHQLCVHEVKGFMADDANVKIKVAAELYPIFKFFVVRQKAKRDGGGFAITEVGT